MPAPIFYIKELECSYGSPQKVVLKVEELSIAKGDIIFLLGKSGSGKSTILETLGLMNNTIHACKHLTFSPDSSAEFDFSDIWNKNNKIEIDNIRKDHFSFIFQNTNLMPNFSVIENICLTQMLQDKTLNEAELVTSGFLKSMDLQNVTKDKYPYELSGGEKQRVAFIRAITPQFTVLFGDEPTGNLDEENASSLMNKLSENIKSNNRTAIIVSHHVDSALDFADHIVVLEKVNQCGVIKKENMLFREGKNSFLRNGKTLDKLEAKNTIKEIMKSNLHLKA